MEKNTVFEELENILGTEAANRLVGFYSGESIYIPKSITIEQTYRKIRDEYKNNGASYRELAVRYGYTQRHIRRIIHNRRLG